MSEEPAAPTPRVAHALLCLRCVQQTAGTKSIFWLDSPGVFNASNVASITDKATFTSAVCSTVTLTTCVCTDWSYTLVGNKNLSGIPTADATNSPASITKPSYACVF